MIEFSGLCVACGREAPGPLGHLCGACVDPQGIMVVCRGCGSRHTVTPQWITNLRRFAPFTIPPEQKGIVLVEESCEKCAGEESWRGSIMVYRAQLTPPMH